MKKYIIYDFMYNAYVMDGGRPEITTHIEYAKRFDSKKDAYSYAWKYLRISKRDVKLIEVSKTEWYKIVERFENKKITAANVKTQDFLTNSCCCVK